MTRKLSRFALCLPLLFALPGIPAAAQHAGEPLAVVVNKGNGVESLSMAQLRKLMLGDVRNWPDQKPVTVVARESSSPVSQAVMANVVRLREAEYRRYIMNAEFRGDETMAVQTASSDLSAAQMVAGPSSSIAIVSMKSLPQVASSVKIIRINGKLPRRSG